MEISICMNMTMDLYWKFMRKMRKNVNTAAEGFMGTGSVVAELIAAKTQIELTAMKVIIVLTAVIVWITQMLSVKIAVIA